MIKAVRLWALHKVGYKMADLYDARNNPSDLNDLIIIELEMMKLKREDQINLIKSIIGR
jgi:hypothetical protein